MLDKTIVERMDACIDKAREILHADTSNVSKRIFPQSIVNVVVSEAHFTFEITDLALALFKEGYRGTYLDLAADINTLLDNKHGYVQAGAPGFMGLFGRDSLITSWQLLDYNPMIARNTLIELARLQGERVDRKTGEQPGKILHEYYPEDSTDKSWFQKYKSKIEWLEIDKPVYFSIDSTLLFIIVYNMYVEKTHDVSLQKKLKKNIERASDWISKYGSYEKDYHHFIGYEWDSKQPGLHNQSWKDSDEYSIKDPVFPVEVQGYAYASMSNKMPKEMFKKDFFSEFYMKEEKYFAFALDGDLKQVKEITSNPGHLLFTGILDEGSRLLVKEKLFSKELWTPYGIRTLSTESENFDPCSYHSGSVWPWDNWVIAQGLKKYGYDKEYMMIKEALFRAYDELGILPEYYGVINDKIVRLPAQYPQAWSSGALLNFLMEEKK